MAKQSRKRVTWTDAESARLREIWGTIKDADVAKELGKSLSSVRIRATVLNLREEKGKRAGTQSGDITLPWSKEEEMLLIKNVGHSSVFELMEMLPNRTRAAIESRCRRLGFSPTQGTFTRCGIERETGYDWRQIKRARDAVGQSWKRYGVRKYIISEEQVFEITEYLRTETRKWSKSWNLDACRVCNASGASERDRHSGDGLCKKCLTGDARIFVKNIGLMRIDEMLGAGEFEVWSGVEWRTTSVIESGIKNIVEVHISNGVRLRMTGDHKLITNSGKVEANDIVGKLIPIQLPSDICYPINAKIKRSNEPYSGRLGDRFPYEWSRDVGILLGVVMGDGCISKGRYPMLIIGQSAIDKQDLDYINLIIKRWCDTKVKICTFVAKPNKKCKNPKPMVRGQWKCASLIKFLSDLGVDKHASIEGRKVPESIWTASLDGVSGFIAGLFGTDGSINSNKSGKIEPSVASVSIEMLRGVQTLLFGFGITSTIGNGHMNVDGNYPVFILSVFGIDNVRRFSDLVNFASVRKSSKLLRLLNNCNMVGTGRKPLRASVVDIGKREKVYDLVNVGPEMQFVANGISVSNCWDKRRYLRTMVRKSIQSGRSIKLTDKLWNDLKFRSKE